MSIKQGVRISIPQIKVYDRKSNSSVNILVHPLHGRPMAVLRKFIKTGFTMGWFSSDTMNRVTVWGTERNLFTDVWDFLNMDIAELWIGKEGK